jgi:hypothetical protein
MIDHASEMAAFVRVVDSKGFSAAAAGLGLTPSAVSKLVTRLETRLGVRLLQRTTRVVRPTLDGEAYYRRCLAIIQDMEDAEGAFAGSKPKGTLRIEVQGTLARHFLMPNLPLTESDMAESFWTAAHWYLAYAGIGLVALHIAAALRHHFWRKDVVLTRMITPLSNRDPE